MSSDATVLSRLPAGHSVRAFLAGTPGSGGTLWIGDDNLSAKARYAVRWYQYHSPDFNSLGAKLFAANNSGGPGAGQFSMPGGRIQLYGLNGHTYSGGSMGDCCISGPPVNVSGYQSNLSGLQGKWWRFEVVLENPAGPGIRYRLFAKNITDNLPEIAVIDTGVPCAGCRPDPAGLGASDLRPPALVNDLIINGYRESEDGSPLAGWRGYSHVLYAGWDTNAGQRIGGAQEVEGSGGGAPPLVAPNPPTSLSAQ
jgi:hypothetical protein